MTKNYKAVLKSSLVMLVLFAVAGSSVAQAQECFARRASGSANTVRAEGMTELLGGIELLVQLAEVGTGFDPPATIEVSIELNTMITNATNDDDGVVMGLTYTDTDGHRNAPDLGTAMTDYTGFEDNEVLEVALGRRHGDHVGDPPSTMPSTSMAQR